MTKIMKQKELYAAPATAVLELAFEQAILEGSITPGFGNSSLGAWDTGEEES